MKYSGYVITSLLHHKNQMVSFLQFMRIMDCPTCDNLPAISHDKVRKFCIFLAWIKWIMWQTLPKLFYRTLSYTQKFCFEILKAIKFVSKCLLANVSKWLPANDSKWLPANVSQAYLYKLLFSRQILLSTRFDNVQWKSFIEVYHALHLT